MSVSICVHCCAFVCACVCIYVFVCLCVYVCMYVHVCVCACLHVCECFNTYICLFVYISCQPKPKTMHVNVCVGIHLCVFSLRESTALWPLRTVCVCGVSLKMCDCKFGGWIAVTLGGESVGPDHECVGIHC